MEHLNIAVIGSGISGLSAAWLLSSRHRVTLYESDNRLGGHANSVNVKTASGDVDVDTGFIVYNEANYPNLTALFEHLGVRTEPTEMSFALSLNDGAYEYASAGFNGFFGQRRNLVRLSHWNLLKDISRFFRTARQRIELYPVNVTLGAFLSREGYSSAFVCDHIIPMGAAIWSTTMVGMLGFPARSFIDFYANHGMLQFRHRPAWRTVSGSSRHYIEKIVENGAFEVQTGVQVKRIARFANHILIADERGVTRPFDHVVIATHADQALKLLDDPDPFEAEHLGKFSYQHNRAVLHRDPRWMPANRKLWSSWNYLKSLDIYDAGLCLTYWMNRLQNLSEDTNLFVTLNPTRPIHPKAVDAAVDYRHPVFDADALNAQAALPGLQGRRRTWFCGSYFGYGFHEDGAASGLTVAEQLGGMRRPWSSEHMPPRIALPQTYGIEAAE